MMAIWELGNDADPDIGNRIEFHNPAGRTYVAKTFGKETIFGREVQKGISARMLEYANQLLERAYEVEAGPDLDADGAADWHIPILGPNGIPLVKYDRRIQPTETCSSQTNIGCTCAANLDCLTLSDYATLPAYLHDMYSRLGYGQPRARGIY
jgi:hypothetical protein